MHVSTITSKPFKADEEINHIMWWLKWHCDLYGKVILYLLCMLCIALNGARKNCGNDG